MDNQYWKDRWIEGKIGFHEMDFHDKLIEHFPKLNPQKGQSVLVPLCGKSLDILWLNDIGLQVHGIEISEQAVESFFSENNLSSYQITNNKDFITYSYQNIIIQCGDIFLLQDREFYDFIYDRASLVALPRIKRKNYSELITQSLKPGGKYFLIVYDYDQSLMDGPPFSIPEQEVNELYQDHFSINLKDSDDLSTDEGSRFSSIKGMQQKVYILEKNI